MHAPSQPAAVLNMACLLDKQVAPKDYAGVPSQSYPTGGIARAAAACRFVWRSWLSREVLAHRTPQRDLFDPWEVSLAFNTFINHFTMLSPAAISRDWQEYGRPPFGADFRYSSSGLGEIYFNYDISDDSYTSRAGATYRCEYTHRKTTPPLLMIPKSY